MEFIRSSLIKDRTAATETLQKDLPINPLSHLIISLDAYNATDEATLAELLAFVNSITIDKMGQTILSLESEDLYALNCYIFGKHPVLTGKLATDNLNRTLSLIVPFGRRVYDPNECYPATKKGELTMSLDYTVPSSAADNGILNIETVELVGATPRQYMKSTLATISAPGATGENDYELPIGNKIIALGIRMTTFYAAAASTLGVEAAKVLVDNSEYGFAFAKAQCCVGEMINICDTQHGNIAAQGLIQPASYFFLDYDPAKDDNYLLDTKGKSSVKLRLDMGVDEATKVMVNELVSI
jgi:hypothetical protein